MTKHKRPYKYLFWSVVIIFLLANAGTILTRPTDPISISTGSVVINELMAVDNTGIPGAEGEMFEWIELHNRGSQAVNLDGWSLTDNLNQPDKWVFPAVTLPAQGYLLVLAAGDGAPAAEVDIGAVEAGEQTLYANFRLSAEGGTLALYPPTSRRYLDSSPVEFGRQRAGISLGRYGEDEEYHYLTMPTPGGPNEGTEARLGVVEPVQFSETHGYYSEPVTVALSAPTTESTIRYTLDGSTPAEDNGTVYTGPIPITTTTPLRAAAFKPGYYPSLVTTHTYIFPDHVRRQPVQPDGWPDTWGTYRIDFQGHRAGEPVQADYEMDPEIVEHPSYGPQLEASLRSLPVVSLTTDLENLDIYFDDPQMRGIESERPASVEMFYPDGSREGFSVNVGLRVQGGVGRWEQFLKHSFRLFFKAQYGETKLHHQVFPDSPLAEFDTVILRAGIHESFSGYADVLDRRKVTYLRDEWARASQIAMEGVGVHGRFVHLYLNGLYWGVYNLVERPDASFSAAYFGGDKNSDWFAGSQGGAVSGQPDRFTTLIRLADEGGLADPAKYATMLEFIDPERFSDYIVLNWTMGSRDWPENNWYVGVSYPAGRNTFWVWDAENTWNDEVFINMGPDAVEGRPFPNVIKMVFAALWENAEFRITFADRMYGLLFNEGVLTDENARERWLRLSEEIELAIIAESARWGDVRVEPPATQDDWWFDGTAYVLDQMEGQAARVVEVARTEGYYPPIDPPIFSQHGGVFSPTLAVSLHSPVGEVYYTTDGSDPRTAISDTVVANAMAYAAPFTLTTATTVKARVHHDGVWSALSEAQFHRAGQQADVRITEIMYNPLDGEGYEFLEIKNFGEVAQDLSYAFFEGIRLHFPRDTVLPPGEHMVLIRDFYAFRQRYPTARFHGIYEGNLANEGETLALRTAGGTVLDSVAYNDSGGWSLTADGSGDSLVLQGLDGDPNSPRTWRASANVHGSPGSDDPAP